ncbi:lipid-A-disaccharide synthase N-terminal domain-containing protein [Leptolyngbya sp. 15MV]|nr:lipid-A-disaccharide synthase N-terminal domain-containing protein [Leptolyngbya sp. 15MV]
MTTPTDNQPDTIPLQPRTRVKWEPAALMVLVLFLGLWLALGPTSRPRFDLRPDATTLDVRIGQSRGVLEAAVDPSTGQPSFRLLMRGADASPIYTGAEIRGMLGPAVHDQAVAARGNLAFRLLNITSWASLVWIAIGLGGQLAFMGRMMLQWIVSEKRRQSIITESFWWFSLIGAVALFSYFVWLQGCA